MVIGVWRYLLISSKDATTHFLYALKLGNMRKLGIILLILGTLQLIASSIYAIAYEWKNITPIIVSGCICILGGALYWLGKRAKQKAQANNTVYKEIGWGKIILYIFIGMMAFGAIGSFINETLLQPQKDKTVEGMVEKANRSCPIDLNGVGTITSISTEGKQVVYHVQYDNTLINLDLVKQNRETMKKAYLLSAYIQNAQGNNNGDKLMQILIEQGYGISIDFSSGSDEFRISISPQEIATYWQQDRLNPTEAIRGIIDMQVKLFHETLPQAIDSGLICTNISVEDNNVVYRVETDEEQYPISNFEDNKKMLKEELYMAWKVEPLMRNMLSLCKVAHTGIIYRFVGNTSRDSCDIVIDADDIFNNTATPEQLKIQ